MILLSGQIPLGIHQSGHAMGGNGGLGIFCPKWLWAWLKFAIPLVQTTWVVFPNGHSRYCAQGKPPYKVGR
jgi:hypothetical protein